MAPSTPFAHASEAEMARILDFYAVRWEYEPDTFPILWNLDGDVVESFSPDFFLPDLDLYLEMTTLRQRLVRKKNRKLRRLRELYPDVKIKLFYARDFRALMLKYGRGALFDDLAGTSGQVALPYGDRTAVIAAPAVATAEAFASVALSPDSVVSPMALERAAPAVTETSASAPHEDELDPARRERPSRSARRRRRAAVAAANANGRTVTADRGIGA